MVTGNLPPLGYSDRQLARMNSRAEIDKHSLFYELGLSSYPPEFINGTFVSPLLRTDSYFNYGRKTGSSSRKTGPSSRKTGSSNKKNTCKKFLKNKSVNPSSGRPIKRGGTKYKKLLKECKPTITKKNCVKFLESGKTINPITGRTVKKDGPIYKSFMKKCKKYSLTGIKENKLSVSGKLEKIPKRMDYLDLSESVIFRPPLPKKPTMDVSTKPTLSQTQKVYPPYVQPPPSTFKHDGIDYTLQQRIFVSFNGKTFKLGSKAIINQEGEEAVITNIGPKLILMRKDLQSKEKRIPVQTFIDLNK